MKKCKNAILGLGISGEAVLRYLLARGESVRLLDKKREGTLADLPIYPDDVRYLEGIERLILSPGVYENHPIRKEALRRGIPLTSEMELALDSLQEEPVTLLAVTGSCGKTTTTSLVTHVLQMNGKRARAYGNIGYPLLNYWEEKPDYAVVELSSFQLSLLPARPIFSSAVIVNLSPNHLDYHGTMENYALAKLRLYSLMKEGAPLFISQKIAEEFGSLIPLDKKKHFFDEEKVASIFSLSYRDRRFKEFAGDQQNSQAAFALCQEAKITKSEFLAAASSFQKPEHRFEFVRVVKEVAYVNDSKATSVSAVMEAVEAVEAKVILIAGGVDKESDFAPWKELFAKKLARLLLIGKAAPKIAALLSSVVPVEVVDTLENAVSVASSSALPGECVLLSPGCASFDQFENYEHRGKRFKELVLGL